MFPEDCFRCARVVTHFPPCCVGSPVSWPLIAGKEIVLDLLLGDAGFFQDFVHGLDHWFRAGNVNQRFLKVGHKQGNAFLVESVRADDIINPEFPMPFSQCLEFFSIRKIFAPVRLRKLNVQWFPVVMQIQQDGAKWCDADSPGDEHEYFPAIISNEIATQSVGFNRITRLEFLSAFLKELLLGANRVVTITYFS